ncbi:hypothetical protein NW064_01885 [Mycoplasmopsis felis]|nr:hypothetical protein [Mycoplasmopsis felis]UWW01404.1 hypothetical protein NW064_01885 [Mycoplasmopsis felis]
MERPGSDNVKGITDKYSLRNFERSNQGTIVQQRPIVKKGQKVEAWFINWYFFI